jgi:predicted peroxiredoxin
MAALLFLVAHSTDDPDRAATALVTALAASEAGHDVALWLTGEGVRLGVQGVCETLREPFPLTAAETVVRLADRGVVLHCARLSLERRDLAVETLRPGAVLADESVLARLVAEGRTAVSL